jgi:hypothetical protein
MSFKKVKASDLLHGFRSGLEDKVSQQLLDEGVPVKYEEMYIEYTRPQSSHKYTPDFELPNGIIIETKGRFMVSDRKKHLLIKEQHPELDIRFVFSNSKAKINKNSKTTYALWCTKNGFKFADKLIPLAWLKD